MEESELEGIGVENQEMERKNDTEESDQVEDCIELLEITEVLQVKVSTFEYERPPSGDQPSPIVCTRPNRAYLRDRTGLGDR